MAINNFYPNYYQQYPYQQPQQTEGLLSARSVEEAYNWPVAPGNSLTFKIENQPLVCTKTRGFSPLEQPVFERYQLVKMQDAPQNTPQPPENHKDYDAQIENLWKEINAIKGQIHASEEVSENV